MRAGLIPALRRGRFRAGSAWAERWRVAVVRPADDPFGQLVDGLPALEPDLSAADQAEFLDKRRGQIESADGLYNSIVALVPPGWRTLLVVDQFEELFTGTVPDEARDRFVAALIGATSRSGGDHPVHVLLTLRADFYHHCWRHGELLKMVKNSQYVVEHIEPEKLRETIEQPLALAGIEAENGLVDTILAEAGAGPQGSAATGGGDPGDHGPPLPATADARSAERLARDTGTLPLLEHALLQLWREGGGRLTHEAYGKIGRLAGAIESHAESIFTGFDRKARARGSLPAHVPPPRPPGRWHRGDPPPREPDRAGRRSRGPAKTARRCWTDW